MTAVGEFPRNATLRAKMIRAYALAETFALEEWANAADSVHHFERDTAEHGPSARYGRAIIRRDRAAVEAERCAAIGHALEEMA